MLTMLFKNLSLIMFRHVLDSFEHRPSVKSMLVFVFVLVIYLYHG